MLVVSDTSPITNLIQVGHLHLLNLIFQEIIITDKVYAELCQLPEQQEILTAEIWIIRRSPKNKDLIAELEEQIESGEAASIVLALEINADQLLIDEKKGRAVAQSFGLKITGLLGILLRAKKDGYLDLVKPVLDNLMTKTSFRVRPQLYYEVLDIAGE